MCEHTKQEKTHNTKRLQETPPTTQKMQDATPLRKSKLAIFCVPMTSPNTALFLLSFRPSKNREKLVTLQKLKYFRFHKWSKNEGK